MTARLKFVLLNSIFKLDVDKSGTIDEAEFVEGLQVVPTENLTNLSARPCFLLSMFRAARPLLPP
jgi:hypothetical protein